MCSVTAALAGGTALMGAVGSYQESKSNKQMANYRAQVASNNARLAGMQADDAIARGQQAESQQRQKDARLAGQQRVGYAKSGVQVDSGSAASTVAETVALSELDAQTIRQNAARQAWGYRNQVNNYQNDAQLSRRRASMHNPGMAGFTSLLGSASRFAASQG